jgi:hypothetical protein
MLSFDKTQIIELVDQKSEACLSLYMPTQPMGDLTQQNPIRFKNLLTEAEDRLKERDLEKDQLDTILNPARQLLEDHTFWQNQRRGLAAFFSPETSQLYRLPYAVEEAVLLDERFHIKPLLPLLSEDEHFYILALSQGEIRLLEGTRNTVNEIELEQLPDDIDEALWFEDPERRIYEHTTGLGPGTERGPGMGGGQPMVFHGHGVVTEERESEQILRYFHRVDEALMTMLDGERAPMVLAGVEYLHPIYHEANSYNYLLEDGVMGNPEALSAQELHEQTWQIVAPIFESQREEAKANFMDLTATNRTSNDMKEIVKAAFYGRVDTLFVVPEVEQWGSFDESTGTVTLTPRRTEESIDLLQAAAVQTLRHDGKVYMMDRDNIPGGELIAAIFRYEKA